jgi:hypothetical protein
MRHSNLFVSSSCRQVIIEEIYDIYLSWIYDKSTKAKLIEELVSTIWNENSQD